MTMNKFSIITICTKAYEDAAWFSVPSWVRLENVEKVYIYTDFDLKYDHEKVVVVNILNNVDDWVSAVGSKSDICMHFYDHYDHKLACFLDADCYALEDFSCVFENNFDIAATRMLKGNETANAGVFFFRINETTKRFFKEWNELGLKYKNLKKGVRAHCVAYEQYSLSEIVHKEYKNKSYLHVLPIDENIYNNEDSDYLVWLNRLRQQKPKILHFKRRTFRNKFVISEMKKIFKNFTPKSKPK